VGTSFLWHAIMKTYVAVTGLLFLLLTVMHLWRLSVEQNLARDPWYLLITAVSLGLAFWAFRIYRGLRSS
jgi:hypothetical protein